jgi:hypothetical protein
MIPLPLPLTMLAMSVVTILCYGFVLLLFVYFAILENSVVPSLMFQPDFLVYRSEGVVPLANVDNTDNLLYTGCPKKIENFC